jgi:hypothetical protein
MQRGLYKEKIFYEEQKAEKASVAVVGRCSVIGNCGNAGGVAGL